MKNINKGFTLIELLVVVAIIGILASVVLAALGSSKNKGSDASTKSLLNNMRTQAELFASSNSNYGPAAVGCNTAVLFTTFSTQYGLRDLLNAVVKSSGGTLNTTILCSSTGTNWGASAPLKSSTGNWCVDNSGFSKMGTLNTATSKCS